MGDSITELIKRELEATEDKESVRQVNGVPVIIYDSFMNVEVSSEELWLFMNKYDIVHTPVAEINIERGADREQEVIDKLVQTRKNLERFSELLLMYIEGILTEPSDLEEITKHWYTQPLLTPSGNEDNKYKLHYSLSMKKPYDEHSLFLMRLYRAFHNILLDGLKLGVCECGTLFANTPRGKPRKYCSNACSMRAYWRRKKAKRESS